MASKLITGSIILLIAGAASCGTYVLLSNAAYIRSSAPVISSTKPEPSPAAESKTFSASQIPFTFKYPANWQLTTTASNSLTTITLESITITNSNQPITDQANLAAQNLTAHADQLISWPGKLGQVTGTFWAASSTVGDTKAPQGPRVFIANINQTTIAVILPEPPYSTGVQRFLDSFATR